MLGVVQSPHPQTQTPTSTSRSKNCKTQTIAKKAVILQDFFWGGQIFKSKLIAQDPQKLPRYPLFGGSSITLTPISLGFVCNLDYSMAPRHE